MNIDVLNNKYKLMNLWNLDTIYDFSELSASVYEIHVDLGGSIGVVCQAI